MKRVRSPTFRDSYDNDCDRDDKDLNKLHRLCIGRSEAGVSESTHMRGGCGYLLAFDFNWIKNLIIRAKKRIKPQSAPTLAMSSARSLSFSWRGVAAVGFRKAGEMQRSALKT